MEIDLEWIKKELDEDRDDFISELVPLLKYDSDMEEVYRRIVEYTSDPFEQICIALAVGYYCFY